VRDQILVFLISLLPVLELRGAIPFGLAKGLRIEEVFFLSLAGNLLVVLPLLILFKYLLKKLERIKFLGKLIHWWFKKVEKESKIIQKYGLFGLILFVALPFPGSGAWSGSIAAVLFNFSLKRAFLGIALGVILAAVLVTFVGVGITRFW